MSSKEEEITQFLRHVGDDVVPDNVVAWIECVRQGGEESCPKHEDCGICRFEYMKRKGWLNLTER